MRKAMLIILSVALAFCSTACEKDGQKELVDGAVQELKSNGRIFTIPIWVMWNITGTLK